MAKRLKSNFLTKSPNEHFSPYVKFLSYEQDGLFLGYQMMANNSSENYYHIDRKLHNACFITGNIFTSETNIAEYIMAQQKKHGLDFVRNLRGEFNILLVKKGRIYLINDRLGLSPMYIYKMGKAVLFCNTAEYLIHSNKANTIDRTSIAEFLAYGFVPEGRTFILDLANQEPGSIVEASKKGFRSKKYHTFNRLTNNSLGHSKKLELVKNKFNEAVRVRAQEERCYSSLSGGWDTRFILANLLELKKNLYAFTAKTKEEDIRISSMVTRALGIKHILRPPRPFSSPEMIEERLRFKLLKTAVPGNKKSRNTGLDRQLLTTPRFEGIFGTELLGSIPEIFLNRVDLKFDDIFCRIFEHDFLDMLRRGKRRKPWTNNAKKKRCDFMPYIFLTQVGRSYLNICYATNWERPTRFFHYLALIPFADSDFVTSLSLLKYPQDFNYKTYQEIYKKYFPGFLTFPWTYAQYRSENNLIKTKTATNKQGVEAKDRQRYLDLMKTNNKFRAFLKNNRIIKKDARIILSRLKELYFLYEWFEAHKGILAKDNFEIYG